jgi:hypothetical protein
MSSTDKKDDIKPTKEFIKDLIKKVGGDEKLTKRRYRKRSKYPRDPENTVRDNIRLEKDAAEMIDVLELHMTTKGYKYLLVCCDLASREFDIQEMKTKDASTVYKAFMEMTKRDYIGFPKYYMISDQGSEFKSIFHAKMYLANVFHKQTIKGRHKSLSMVDSLMSQLGRIFNAYMNAKEAETGKVYKNWTGIIDIVRKELNKIRKVDLPKDLKKDKSQALVQTTEDVKVKGKVVTKFKKPKFREGEMVYRLLEVPENVLGKQQMGKFREGDVRIEKTPRKIIEVLYMNGREIHPFLVHAVHEPSQLILPSATVYLLHRLRLVCRASFASEGPQCSGTRRMQFSNS